MQKPIFSVYDKKAALYSQPFLTVNEGTAIRMFNRACHDPNNDISLYADDYALYHIGMFCDESGQITPQYPPVHVIDGSTCINMPGYQKPEVLLDETKPNTGVN